MISQLIEQLESRAGTASLCVQRPRRGDWQAILFQDHEDAAQAVYETGHGDTLTDALVNLLARPRVATGL